MSHESHCATSAASNNLQILRANDNSNKFTVVPGGIFLPDDHYGVLRVQNGVPEEDMVEEGEVEEGAGTF